MQDWEVLAEESLDASLEPVEESGGTPGPELQASGASITWSGDGKHFATVCNSRCICVLHTLVCHNRECVTCRLTLMHAAACFDMPMKDTL